MRTRFDELRDEAREHLKEANKKLKEALDEDTWGYDEMKHEYLEGLDYVQHQLAIFLRTKI